MSSNRNIIKVYFKGTHLIYSKPQYQYNHGMILHFADLNLPQAFETHFSNKPHGNSKTVIGSDNQVEIPDEYFWSGANEIYAWVYLHSDVEDGETVFEVRIPLTKRAKPSDEEPLPDQQSAIDRAIAELNHAVEQTGEDVEQTGADRQAVSDMLDGVIGLEESASQSAQTATQKAQEASTSASNAEDSEQEAKGYADDAKGYAENAFSSKEIAVAKASEAEGYASDAEQAKIDAEDVRSDTVQLKQDVVALKEQTDTNVTHYPKIVDGYWYVWNARQNDFVNTGVEATGEDGEKGDQGDKGDKGDKGESGVYVGDDEPLDEDYNVWVDTDDGDVIEDVVEDVQINGVSIVSNGIANIPPASTSLGLVKIAPAFGMTTQNDFLVINQCTDAMLKNPNSASTSKLRPITPDLEDKAVFYGLAKASGDTTQSASSNPIGTYTDEAKTAIQNMLGVPSVDDIGNGLKYIKDDPSDKGGVIEGYINGESLNTASGEFSHAEGYKTQAVGNNSHAEGHETTALTDNSHTEGRGTKTNGLMSHAEGAFTLSTGLASHSEGLYTQAIADYSHAEGSGAAARGNSSHAEGFETIAYSKYQHAQGKYNVEDFYDVYADIVGNGSLNNRSNAYALDWNGNGHYMGDVYIGANADSTGGEKVATVSDINSKAPTIIETASGSTVSFSDGANDMPLKSLTFEITPIQDLHGYDYPWIAGGGKNKFDTRGIDITVAGIHATSDADGVISLSGTRDKSTGWKPIISYENIPVGNYYFSTNTPYLTCLLNYTQKTGAVTVSEGDVVRIALFNISTGDTVDVSGIKCQLELGSTATEWTPYENICPITNRTEVNYTVNGLAHVGTWDEVLNPVYGGRIEVIDGLLEVDMSGIDLGTLDWKKITTSGTHWRFWAEVSNPQIIIGERLYCSHYKWVTASDQYMGEQGIASQASSPLTLIMVSDERYADAESFKAAMSGVMCVYKCAPSRLQADRTEIRTVLGQNSISADSGDTTVEYCADTALFIQNHMPEAPVTDVQINGTSILSNGVANVPIASGSLGLVATSNVYGIGVFGSSGIMYLKAPTEANMKAGYGYSAIQPPQQHIATFYGLAKAAGHDEKNSTLPVGQYTEDAKSAISDMLNGSVSVSGTTPTIVAKSGIRYVCGEVASLDFTPPASGICDVVFTSGSTPTVLTVPSTVKWANGFDPTSLDADTTYELNIMDGLGVCGTWT